MDELLVFGASAVTIIVAGVQLLKVIWPDVFSEGRWAILASVALGLLLSVFNKLSEIVPGFSEWYQVIVVGLAAGLGACGLYDVGKRAIVSAKAALKR
jgi:hypothetical protein